MASVPKPIVAGNWKMNGDLSRVELFKSTLPEYNNINVVLCPPSVFLSIAGSEHYMLGAQNCAQQVSGAHTGEVSADMLKQVGCEFVIVGHSERRQDQGETNAMVAAKTKTALNAGLTPIVCVGESLDVRENGDLFEFISAQLDAVVEVCGERFITHGVIAYEPIWAIGTGKTASPEQAQEVHAFIRKRIEQVSTAAMQMPILYGGSVKPENAKELFAQPDINGGLIGGASLDLTSFSEICRAANERV